MSDPQFAQFCGRCSRLLRGLVARGSPDLPLLRKLLVAAEGGYPNQ